MERGREGEDGEEGERARGPPSEGGGYKRARDAG